MQQFVRFKQQLDSHPQCQRPPTSAPRPCSIHATHLHRQQPAQRCPRGCLLPVRATNDYGEAYDNLFRSKVFQSELVVKEFDRYRQTWRTAAGHLSCPGGFSHTNVGALHIRVLSFHQPSNVCLHQRMVEDSIATVSHTITGSFIVLTPPCSPPPRRLWWWCGLLCCGPSAAS